MKPSARRGRRSDPLQSDKFSVRRHYQHHCSAQHIHQTPGSRQIRGRRGCLTQAAERRSSAGYVENGIRMQIAAIEDGDRVFRRKNY